MRPILVALALGLAVPSYAREMPRPMKAGDPVPADGVFMETDYAASLAAKYTEQETRATKCLEALEKKPQVIDSSPTLWVSAVAVLVAFLGGLALGASR